MNFMDFFLDKSKKVGNNGVCMCFAARSVFLEGGLCEKLKPSMNLEAGSSLRQSLAGERCQRNAKEMFFFFFQSQFFFLWGS